MATNREAADQGQPDLSMTTEAGVADMVDVLLKAGIDPDRRDAKGRTPLVYSLKTGNCTPAIVASLIKHGDGSDLQATDEDGSTMLHIAAAKEKCDVVSE